MDFEKAAVDIFLPVLEASIIYASHYCKACGRSIVTAKDVEYALKYAAMTSVGKYTGSLLPEEDSESDSESSCSFVDDDDEEPFTRYEGDDEDFLKMNEAYDTWDSWEPSNPAEHAIKNAIEKQNGRVHTE